MIRLSKLNKHYNKGRQNHIHAVNDVEMTLPDSGMIAIFGRSGCGKTTLLNMIGGLDDASSGSVELDGESISPNADRVRNLGVGYIFQNYNLSSMMTVYENVAASLKLCGVSDESEIERRVIAALKSVDMAKFRNRMPSALSGGQQQRVAIARAIVKNPALILADEPTGNLDEQNTVMVMDLLKAISKERLVLLVTHEAHLVDSYCDRVIEMIDGRISEERENSVTSGYHARKSNEIYLGDMEREEFGDGEVSFEYYGDRENRPTSLRIISMGGVLYISAPEGVKLKIADSSSELIVHEGSYTAPNNAAIGELPSELREPIGAGKTGRIYNFKGALRSGFKANFGKGRKRKKMLIGGLACFSSIIVFVMAAFGTAINNYIQVEQSYNSQLVAIDAEKFSDAEARALVDEGRAELYTIESIYNERTRGTSGTLGFSFGSFETSAYGYASAVSAKNIYSLPQSMLSGRKLVEGKGEIAQENEIIITQGLADIIISSASVSSIRTYRDLIYSRASSSYIGYFGDSFGVSVNEIAPYPHNSQTPIYKVVGVVEGRDSEVFYHEYTYLQNTLSKLYGTGAGYFCDLAHSELDLPPLERGSVYVMSPFLEEYFAIGANKYKVVGSFDKKLGEEELSRYMLEQFGIDMSKGLDSYVQYAFGYTSFDEYAKEEGIDAKSDPDAYEAALKKINAEYETLVARAMSDLKASYYYSYGPAVIMHLEDMKQAATSYSNGMTQGADIAASFYQGGEYVFYSSKPDELARSLEEKYGSDAVVTPTDVREYLRSDYYSGFVSLAVTFVIVAAIMSLCLYYIMRSALLGDIKEVGISRAIGVSRRNLCYRYFIESMVLFALTVFVGYLLSSFMMSALSGASTGALAVAYYPSWLALITLALVFAITALCGQIPIRLLLRKTPAEILAKYDI